MRPATPALECPDEPDDLVTAAASAPELCWRPGIGEEQYARAVRRVREHLAPGDSYQVNLTFPLAAVFRGDSFSLFARLVRAQRADRATYLDFGRYAVCSASPELFLERNAGRVRMRPMKGTANRGRTSLKTASGQRRRCSVRQRNARRT